MCWIVGLRNIAYFYYKSRRHSFKETCQGLQYMKGKYKHKWNIKVNADKSLLGKYLYLKALKIKSKYV